MGLTWGRGNGIVNHSIEFVLVPCVHFLFFFVMRKEWVGLVASWIALQDYFYDSKDTDLFGEENDVEAVRYVETCLYHILTKVISVLG